MKLLRTLLGLLSFTLLSSAAEAATVTSVQITGPKVICAACPPGGFAEYRLTVKGTDLDPLGYSPFEFKYSIWDDDTGPDSELIPETSMSLAKFETTDQYKTWIFQTTFKLYCEAPDCEIEGDSASGRRSSGESKTQIYALLERSFGSNLGQSALFDVSCVPEPGTWALMIGGFGAVGGALRRRQRLGAGC